MDVCVVTPNLDSLKIIKIVRQQPLGRPKIISLLKGRKAILHWVSQICMHIATSTQTMTMTSRRREWPPEATHQQMVIFSASISWEWKVLAPISYNWVAIWQHHMSGVRFVISQSLGSRWGQIYECFILMSRIYDFIANARNNKVLSHERYLHYTLPKNWMLKKTPLKRWW